MEHQVVEAVVAVNRCEMLAAAQLPPLQDVRRGAQRRDVGGIELGGVTLDEPVGRRCRDPGEEGGTGVARARQEGEVEHGVVVPARCVQSREVADRVVRLFVRASRGLHAGGAGREILEQQREAHAVVVDCGVPAPRRPDVDGLRQRAVEADLGAVPVGNPAPGLVLAGGDLGDQGAGASVRVEDEAVGRARHAAADPLAHRRPHLGPQCLGQPGRGEVRRAVDDERCDGHEPGIMARHDRVAHRSPVLVETGHGACIDVRRVAAPRQ